MGWMGSATNRVTTRVAIALSLVFGATLLLLGVRLAPARAEQVTVAGSGYWMAAADGGIFSFGDAQFYGSRGGKPLNKPIVGMAATPSGLGYWFVASDGGIFSYGDAGFYGSMGGRPLNSPVVGMAATPSGKGYWMVAADGGIFTFGDAPFYDSMGGKHLNQPIVGMAATPTGQGYWFVASDGGIFSFGDAPFYGSKGGEHLNEPIVGMAPYWDGTGYWFVARDGGIFSFGNAPFRGSMGGQDLSAPIVGMAADPDGDGYWFVGADGEVYGFEAPDFGSKGGEPLNQPVVGMAPTTFLDTVPVIVDDVYATPKATPLVVSAPGVLANDSDADGDRMGADVWDEPAHGTVVFGDADGDGTGEGSFTYTPDPDFVGTDTFTYLGHDYVVGQIGTVTITVTNNAPTVAVTGGPSGPTNDSTPTFTGTAADNDGSVSAVQVSVDSGPFTSFCTSGCGTWTYNHATALSQTVHSFRFRSLDNQGAFSTLATRTITVDTTAPTVTLNQKSGQADPTNASPVEFTAVFSEPATGFAADDVSFTGTATTGTPVVSGSGTTYNVAVPVSGDGTVVPRIVAGRATDAAGNGNTASSSTDDQVVFDKTAPTFDSVVATADSTTLVAGFSEPLLCSTVQAADFLVTFDGVPASVTGATCTGLTDATIDVTVAEAPTTDQTALVTASGVADQAGNALAGSATRQAATNATPTVAVTSGPADNASSGDNTPTYGGTAADSAGGTVTKVEAQVDSGPFTVNGVACTNCGTASATWTWTPTTAVGDGPHTFTFRAVDDAGAASAAPAVRHLTVDTMAPAVTVNEATGQADPTNASPVHFSVRFTEPVTGFDATDVSIGGTATAGTPTVTGTGASYEVSVPVTGGGTVIASIAAAKAVDGGGNANTASTSTDNTVTYDTTRPTVAIEKKSGQADPTNGSSVDFTVTFSEEPQGLALGDFTVGGTATHGTPALSGMGTVYTLTVPVTGDGTVNAAMAADQVTDKAGNGNSASTSTDNEVLRDATAPTVTVEKKSGQSDPTNLPTVQFTVTFSETVTDFDDSSDVTVGGTATTGTPTITGSGTTYTVTIPVVTDGTVVASVPSAKAQDAAGNGNAESNEATVTRDSTHPTFDAVSASNGSTLAVATFSEPLLCSTVSSSDFSAAFGNAGKAVTTAVCTGDADDTIELTLAEAPAPATTVNVSLVGLVTDTAGNAANPGTRSTTTNALPTVTVGAGPADGGATNDTTPTYSGTAADSDGTVSGIHAAVDGGSSGPDGVTCTCGTANATWTFTPTTPLSAGPHTVSFVAIDDDGDATSPAVSQAVTVDLVAPTVTVGQAAAQADPTKGDNVHFTVAFSEPVTGFEVGDLTFGGTATRGAPTMSGSGPYDITVPVTADGTVTASLAADKATDAAGNGNATSTTTDDTVTVDRIKPVLDGVAAVNGVAAATAHFSEPVLCSTVATGDFTMTIDLVPTSVTGVTCDGDADDTVDLALDAAPDPESRVRLALLGTVTDPAGNAADPATVTSDTNSLPTVNVSGGPADGDLVNDTTPTYSGTAADSDGLVAAVKAKVDGGSFSDSGVTCTGCGTGSATWSFTPATPLADGAHTILFEAVDDDGEATATPKSRGVTVDAARPGVTVERASADATNASPVTFTVTFTENVSGFAAADVSLSGSATRGAVTVAPTSGPEDVYTVSVEVTGDGDVVASVPADKATDAAGNGNLASTSQDNSVVYDTTPPQFDTLTAIAGNATVTAAFSEPVLCSTVQGTDFTVTVDGLPAEVTAVACQGTGDDRVGLTLDTTPGATDTVIADLVGTVTDLAGNQAASAQRQGGATAAPTLAITSKPAEDATNDNTPTYGGTAADSDGLVRRIEAAVDGGAWTTTGMSCTSCETNSATWSYTAPAALADGPHTFAFRAWDNAAAVSDENGVVDAITIDIVRPTVAVADPTATNAAPVFTVTFSEPVDSSAVGRADFTVGGTAFNTPSLADTIATVTITPASNAAYEAVYSVKVEGAQRDGTVTLAVADKAARDLAGNDATASTDDGTATYDTTAPTVTAARALGQPEFTDQPTAAFAVGFSEPVADFTAADVTVGGTAPTSNVAFTGSGTAYTVTVTTTGDGTVTLSVPAAAAHDAAGNATAAVPVSADTTVTRDTVDPAVTAVAKSATQATPTNHSPVSFDVTFSEDVVDFDDASDVVAGGTATAGTPTFTGGPRTFTVSIPLTGDGDVSLSVAAGAAADPAGNPNPASAASAPVTYDATRPTLTEVDPDAGSTTMTATFSEDLACATVAKTDFTAGFGATPTTPVVVADATCLDDVVTLALGSAPAANSTVTVTVVGSIEDLAGNTVQAPTSKSAVTNALPTLAVSSPADNFVTNDTTPTYVGTAADSDGTVAAVKAKVDSGSYSAADVTCTGCATASASWSFTPATPLGLGAHTVAFVAVDNEGIESTPTTLNLTVEQTKPTVSSVARSSGQAAVTNSTNAVSFDVAFSEDVVGFTAADVALSGAPTGTVTVTQGASAAAYTVTVQVTGDGTLVLAVGGAGTVVTDVAGNPLDPMATPPSASVRVDRTVPTATISPAAAATNTTPVSFTVTFDDPADVTGFTADDVKVEGSAFGGALAMPNVVVTKTGVNTYTVDVTNPGSDGAVTVSTKADAVTDAAGNKSPASATATTTYDTARPAATVAEVGSDPMKASSAQFTIGFGEPVTGFTLGDITITGPAGSATLTGSGASYTLTVPFTGDGTVTATVPDNVATDAAGNTNTTGSADITRDTTGPVFQRIAATIGNATAKLTFNEALDCTTVDKTDFSASFGGAGVAVNAGACASGSTTVVDITFASAPAAGQLVIVRLVPATNITDALGNVATPKLLAAPAMSITSGQTPVPSTTQNAETTTDTTPTYAGTATAHTQFSPIDSVMVKVGAAAATADGVTCAGCGTRSVTWSWTPTTALTPGVYTLTFIVTDQNGSTVQTSRTLTVAGATVPPVTGP